MPLQYCHLCEVLYAEFPSTRGLSLRQLIYSSETTELQLHSCFSDFFDELTCPQVNEALNEEPQDNLDFSLRSETDQILTVGKRIALCMTRCDCIHFYFHVSL